MSTPTLAEYATKRKVAQERKAKILALKAEGLSLVDIAKKVGVHRSTVKYWLRDKTVDVTPQLMKIAGLEARRAVNERIKDRSVELIWENIEPFAQMIQAAVKSQDIGAFDTALKALERLTRISATASVEGQKLEVSGMSPIPSAQSVDLKILISQLLAP
jgi:transcriptional regulator with XRE-family HTH domain